MPSPTLEQAYASGDHRTARSLASATLRDTADPEQLALARTILANTAPDPFLALVGALGLGLVAWLVYNYVL
jgi:hypothetical protein